MTGDDRVIGVGSRKRWTAVLLDTETSGHDLSGHPENLQRLLSVEDHLASLGLLEDRPIVPLCLAEPGSIEAVHSPRLLDTLIEKAEFSGEWIDPDTYLCKDSVTVALRAAGAAVAAVDAVVQAVVPRAFALVRPPGHHATPDRSMGFCLLNNVAIAAARALEIGLQRVAIVDWDVHHGNGTQDIFYSRADVRVCSMHQYPFYPGTGRESERGDGAGDGHNLNVPMSAGAGDSEYLSAIDSLIIPWVEAYEPELILVSAGYDAHVDDPLAGMRVTDRGFAAIAERIRDLANRVADGRLVAVLEGGYDPDALARSVASTLRVFDGEVVGRV
ncbi:histone deacetylase [soil metagenome]